MAREIVCNFLQKQLNLNINPKNDFAVTAKDGLYFLGHEITDQKISVDKHTTKAVLAKINARNASSYKALYLDERYRKQLDWILLNTNLT